MRSGEYSTAVVYGKESCCNDFNDGIVVRSPGNLRQQSNFSSFGRPTAARGRDGKELIQCPTMSCDGMGHVSGNYATHRRQAKSFIC